MRKPKSDILRCMACIVLAGTAVVAGALWWRSSDNYDVVTMRISGTLYLSAVHYNGSATLMLDRNPEGGEGGDRVTVDSTAAWEIEQVWQMADQLGFHIDPPHKPPFDFQVWFIGSDSPLFLARAPYWFLFSGTILLAVLVVLPFRRFRRTPPPEARESSAGAPS